MRRAGRYELLEVLGHGATSTVWRARGDDGSMVAIKELVQAWGADPAAMEREVEALAGLDVPGVPRVIERFVAAQHGHDVVYVVEELIEGESLDRELERRRIDVREALSIAAELLEVLAGLHARGVVHRDVKPANIVRRSDGALVLVDFGSASIAREAAADAHFTTSGTIGFMPPEQLAGVVRPANDVYAVGALVVALLTRRAPAELLDDHLALAWRATGLALHPAQAAWLDALLAPLDRRPSDARALAARARAIAGLDPSVRSRRPSIVAGALACATLACAAVALAAGIASTAPPADATPPMLASTPPPLTAPGSPLHATEPEWACVTDTSMVVVRLAPSAGRCERTGDCDSIDDGSALGLELDELCRQTPDPSVPGVVLRSDASFATSLGGERVECTRTLDLPWACTVTCRHAIEPGADRAALRARFDAHVARTRDALGAEQSAMVQGALMFPRREHVWGRGRHTLRLELDMGMCCEVGERDCATQMRTRFTRTRP